MSWKDDYRDEKEASGLSWDEFHRRRFVHVDDLDGATATLEALDDHVQALTDEYADLRKELFEVKVLLEREGDDDE